jgi:hypothetical protein
MWISYWAPSSPVVLISVLRSVRCRGSRLSGSGRAPPNLALSPLAASAEAAGTTVAARRKRTNISPSSATRSTNRRVSGITRLGTLYTGAGSWTSHCPSPVVYLSCSPARLFKDTNSGADERTVWSLQFAESGEVIGAGDGKHPSAMLEAQLRIFAGRLLSELEQTLQPAALAKAEGRGAVSDVDRQGTQPSSFSPPPWPTPG